MYTGPNISDDGLVLSLDAANTKSYISGSLTWTDLSRNGNSGTLVNGPTYDSSSLGSIVFDGVNDFVTSSLNLPSANPFTINSWVYYAAGSGQFPMIVSNNGGRNDVKLLLGIKIGSNQAPGFNLYMANSAQTNVQILPEVNKWYNVAATYSSDRATVYVNGIFQDSTVAGTFGGFTTGLWIGNGTNGGNSYWKGNISSVQIYNRALSAQEILQNYEGLKSRYGL